VNAAMKNTSCFHDIKCWLAAIWDTLKEMVVISLIYGTLFILVVSMIIGLFDIASWIVLQLKQSLGF
jgi:hypothetical protein ngonS_06117